MDGRYLKYVIEGRTEGKKERRTKIQMRTWTGGQKDRNTNEDVDKGTKGQKYK